MIEFTIESSVKERKARSYPVFEGSILPVRIEPMNKQKKKVFLEDGTVLQLYNGEIRQFQIEPDTMIEGEVYAELMHGLCKRARSRALHLLQSADRPSTAIAQKLRQNGYPEEIVSDAIAYLDGYGYLNDSSYIQRYITAHESTLSRQQILQKLQKMGLSADQIQEHWTEESASGELQALQKLVEKYCRSGNMNDADERRRIINRLLRRGFSYGDIRQALEAYMGENVSDESYFTDI